MSAPAASGPATSTPKDKGKTVKIVLLAIGGIICVMGLLIRFVFNAPENTENNEELADGMFKIPTETEPLKVTLTQEWTKVIYYTMDKPWEWNIACNKHAEVQFCTDIANPATYWFPLKEWRNIDAGDWVFGRVINKEKQPLSFWFIKK